MYYIFSFFIAYVFIVGKTTRNPEYKRDRDTSQGGEGCNPTIKNLSPQNVKLHSQTTEELTDSGDEEHTHTQIFGKY